MAGTPGGAAVAHVDFLADLDVLRPEWPMTRLLAAGDVVVVDADDDAGIVRGST
ncbi:hypothetical protein [Microbacterium marinilacus]|uniref:hypothetical protein n=1 Tax=Microbacterium marinilacus TaxID=415209 RepID=UPI001C8D042D|nr:hypothetical protein [Microbacterium marinilacus]MBY0688031.1 hypothetical protein [Microbacterium marinilacus]